MTFVSDGISGTVPERGQLETGRSRWWHLSAGEALLAAFWGAFFCLLDNTSLQGTDFWGQVAYGRWILEARALPHYDPLVPLLSGAEVFDAAWLSQVAFGIAASWGGAEGLSLLFTVTMLAAHLVLVGAFHVQCRQWVVAHFCVALIIVLAWSRLWDAHSDVFGMLCFALLLRLLATDRAAGDSSKGARGGRSSWTVWLGVPALMSLWANLHASFACGLLVLACWMCGAIVEAAWRGRSLRAVLGDRAVRKWTWIAELGLVATCINPYGARLVLHTLWLADPGQLGQLPEWSGLTLLGTGGRALVLSLFLAMAAFRHSRRRLAVADFLLLVVFTFVLARGTAMAWWYAAACAAVLAPHLADLASRMADAAGGGRPGRALPTFGFTPGESWTYSLLAAMVAGMCFLLSPSLQQFTGGSPPSPAEIYGATTPCKLTEYLRANPPQGQVFNPDWWGDWLVWDGPPGIQVFMTARMDLAPTDVWTDYRIVRETRTGWDQVLHRYGVGTVVADSRRQKTLIKNLESSDQWEVKYKDELSAVYGYVPRESSGDSHDGESHGDLTGSSDRAVDEESSR